MKQTLVLAFFLATFPTHSAAADPAWAQERGSVVQDSVVSRKVLSAVRAHIRSITKDRRRPLTVKDGKKTHKFIVVGFLDAVSLSKGTYTAQIDADEFDHKIPRILYVDVKFSKTSFKVTRIRIGPNHFRENDPRR